MAPPVSRGKLSSKGSCSTSMFVGGRVLLNLIYNSLKRIRYSK